MVRSCTAIAVMAASAMSAAPRDAIAGSAKPELRITVRVDDTAGVQGAYLKLAEARAAEVFAMSGVQVEWVDGREATRLNLMVPYTILIMAEAPAALKAA